MMMMSPVEEEFSIVWKGHGGHLSECLEGLGADFSDVSLSCSGTGSSGGSISAHKLILASCSPYFHKIFREHPGQTQTLIILSDIPRDILLDLLTYMYQGSVSLSEKRVPLFLQAAKHLQIKGIGACEEPTAHQATNNLSILASAAALDGRLLEKQAPPSYRVPKYTCPSSHLPQEQENEEPTQPMDVLEEGASSLPISPPLLTIPDPHLFINNREPPKSPLLPNKILPSPPPEENGSASPAIKREDNVLLPLTSSATSEQMAALLGPSWKSRQPRMCHYCKRMFSNKFNLKQHILNMHTVGRELQCEQCQKKVKNKWYLRRHHVTHHGAPLKK